MKLEVKNLSKKFKNEFVLENVNLSFEENNIYGLIGKNGSGKSVFLKMICGLYKPTTGQILFDGEDYISKNGYPKDTRATIEKPDFIADLSGFDNLKLLAKIQNKIGDKEIEEALRSVNLYEERNKKFHKYSQGMKQKLAIAQVLMEDPKIIILDEPFNGIEEESAQKLRLLLKKIKKDKIIIIATHYKEDLENIVDEIYKVENGKICKQLK